MIGQGCATSVLVTFFCLLATICHLTAGADEADKVTGLPGISTEPTFNQYSGYLDGQTDNIQLHYWLVEAKANPETAPLLLWLNGGPGCSSLDGLLNENGPFMMNDDGSLTDRKYTWNELANVLYLETPAGTGFSFAKNGIINTTDDQSGEDNYYAMKNFLTKFPEYNGRDFYIAGQSFAGVYIPMLAKRLVENPMGLELKGIAIGNGLTNNQFNDNSLIYYARYHGVIDKKMWENILQECCDGQSALYCMFTKGAAKQSCLDLLDPIKNKQSLGLDYYNIFRPCDGGVTSANAAAQASEHFDDSVFVERHRMAAEASFYGSETCINYAALESYLNREDVKAALHITKTDIPWKACNEILPSYIRQYTDQKQFILNILNGGVNVLIYNGDVDGVCNFVGGDWFAESLELLQTDTYSSWLYVNEKGEKQVGGWRKTYTSGGNKVIFTTVRGSGHMVPRDTPASAYHMISNFIASATLD